MDVARPAAAVPTKVTSGVGTLGEVTLRLPIYGGTDSNFGMFTPLGAPLETYSNCSLRDAVAGAREFAREIAASQPNQAPHAYAVVEAAPGVFDLRSAMVAEPVMRTLDYGVGFAGTTALGFGALDVPVRALVTAKGAFVDPAAANG